MSNTYHTESKIIILKVFPGYLSIKFIFTHPVDLPGIWVKFVYKGHRVKVKVTGAKNVENSYSCNVKVRSATSFLFTYSRV